MNPAEQAVGPAPVTHSVTLITNARIFDGHSDKLTGPMSVLIDGNKIAKIAPTIETPAGATVIDAGGRTLSPGFMDAHSHVMGQMPFGEVARADQYFQAVQAAAMAKLYLSRGYTTIRDVGGNSFSLKMAIDRGMVEGPRIYTSGSLISQTVGHADHRPPNEPSQLIGGQPSQFMKHGHDLVVDGEAEVLRGVRDQLRRGASQIKITVGGGAGSEQDPLDVVQFSPAEVRAAAQAAGDWGTYVTARVYNSAGIRRAIDAGVKCIEHANLVDEPTLKLMKDKGIWLSPQVSVYAVHPVGFTEDQYKKFDQAFAGLDSLFSMVRKIGFEKIAFGSDIITNPKMLAKINDEFTYRTKWFAPAEIMKQATYNNGQLVAMSGSRNPYPGKLGVIEEGTFANLLLINGDPLSDISILTRPEENLALIMKDGVIYKNLLSR